MTAAWLLYVLGVGTLFAIGAVLLASALRHFGQSVRFVHAAALASMLVLAVIALRRDAVEFKTIPSTVSVAVPAASVAPDPKLLNLARAGWAEFGDAMGPLYDAVRRRTPPTTTRIALAVWTSVSLALLTLFVSVNRRLSRARRSWACWSVDGTPVRVSLDVGPAVIGLLRPEIVVPRWLLGRPGEAQRLIMAHEREHLRARDHLLLGAAWLAAIAVPWHPAVWFLVSRIRLSIELDCDARVLRGGAPARSYGALLIETAAQQRALGIGVLALVDGRSHLERRLLAMKPEKGRHAVARGLMRGITGGLLVVAACEAKVPTVAEVANMDVGTLEKKAAQLDVSGKLAKTDYFVNGAPVSADSARSIAAAKIGSVEVVKGKAKGGRDTIFVSTTDHMRTRDDSQNGYPGGAIERALGGNAVLMIDNVVQPQGVKTRLDPNEIASISVMKPGKDPNFPNGVIGITTKKGDRRPSPEQRSRAPDPFAALERKMPVTRTDSVMVRSAAGLSSATGLLRDPAKGPDRVVFVPGGDSVRSFGLSVSDVERAAASPEGRTSVRTVPRATFDSTKPYAVEIDGVRATMADLEALKDPRYASYWMYPHDMSAESSDPAAKNGLLRVRTKKPERR